MPSNFSYTFCSVVYCCCCFFLYFRWLHWTSPDTVRDDVDEADSPVCGRQIIDVKLVAERLGLGCCGCGEKLYLVYNILLKNGSELVSTMSFNSSSIIIVM